MAHSVTANGNAQLDTAQKKFGSASGLFDGTGDYLTIPDSADFYFTGDFSIDFQIRFNVETGAQVIYSQSADANNEANLYTNGSGRIYFTVVSAASAILSFYTTFSPSANTWYHIELVRNSNTWYIFIDGVAGSLTLDAGSYSISYPDYAGTVYIGKQGSSTNNVNGWLDEFRVSNTARHTANFTAPSAAYTTDANTKLLLHMDGADTSTEFLDASTGSASPSASLSPSPSSSESASISLSPSSSISPSPSSSISSSPSSSQSPSSSESPSPSASVSPSSSLSPSSSESQSPSSSVSPSPSSSQSPSSSPSSSQSPSSSISPSPSSSESVSESSSVSPSPAEYVDFYSTTGNTYTDKYSNTNNTYIYKYRNWY